MTKISNSSKQNEQTVSIYCQLKIWFYFGDIEAVLILHVLNLQQQQKNLIKHFALYCNQEASDYTWHLK